MSLPIAGRRRKKAEASDGAEEVKAETLGAGEAKGESKGEPKTIGWGDDMDEAPEAKSPGCVGRTVARGPTFVRHGGEAGGGYGTPLTNPVLRATQGSPRRRGAAIRQKWRG